MRNHYSKYKLSEKEAPDNPVLLFKIWIDQALAANCSEPAAMTLATVTTEGRPAGRIVLLKGISDNGIRFFTNYKSNKGHHIAGNPFAAAIFFWPELERQVRMVGKVSKMSPAESDAYFSKRPEKSRISAIISPQSQVIPNRKYLEDKFLQYISDTSKNSTKRPDFWGGYLLIPEQIEFWQGRPDRLHDRLLYSRHDSGWVLERLAP